MRPASAPLAVALATLAVVGSTGCATTTAPGPGATGKPPSATPAAPDAVMARFLAAVDAGRWPEAYGLLSARWRAAYTARRLELDFGGAGPVARESAARVQAALAAGERLEVTDGRATLPVAPGRAAVLVAEAGGWRVDALE